MLFVLFLLGNAALPWYAVKGRNFYPSLSQF